MEAKKASRVGHFEVCLQMMPQVFSSFPRKVRLIGWGWSALFFRKTPTIACTQHKCPWVFPGKVFLAIPWKPSDASAIKTHLKCSNLMCCVHENLIGMGSSKVSNPSRFCPISRKYPSAMMLSPGFIRTVHGTASTDVFVRVESNLVIEHRGP